MIVDANVLLRIMDGTESAQGRAARARVQAARTSGESLTVLSATVLELAYVLLSEQAGYGWDRDAVAGAVEAIVDDPGLAVEHGDALRAAAVVFRSRSIDLHDCLVNSLAEQRNLRVLSFDSDLRKLGNSERP